MYAAMHLQLQLGMQMCSTQAVPAAAVACCATTGGMYCSASVSATTQLHCQARAPYDRLGALTLTHLPCRPAPLRAPGGRGRGYGASNGLAALVL
jgi:hypothetical protein